MHDNMECAWDMITQLSEDGAQVEVTQNLINAMQQDFRDLWDKVNKQLGTLDSIGTSLELGTHDTLAAEFSHCSDDSIISSDPSERLPNELLEDFEDGSDMALNLATNAFLPAELCDTLPMLYYMVEMPLLVVAVQGMDEAVINGAQIIYPK
ncbi:hypothetical protein F4604DRAFT_1920217 [Suillus subluteus]|nr:hypothetical protein F4604DRAFT_1920217 [Suillus subluteus]